MSSTVSARLGLYNNPRKAVTPALGGPLQNNGVIVLDGHHQMVTRLKPKARSHGDGQRPPSFGSECGLYPVLLTYL